LVAPNPIALRLNFGSLSEFLGNRKFSASGLAAFGGTMVGALFSADAWANVTFAASEVREPRRNLPRALALGTTLVIGLYLLTNLSYMCELPVMPVSAASRTATIFSHGIAEAAGDRVATAAMRMVWGDMGAVITALLVMLSTFGCANGLILTGARVIYAMSRDRLFFPAGSLLNHASVPAVALIVQGFWASLLTLSGTYSELLDYVIFAQLLFYALTVGAIFVLRVKRPAATRPYRAWGYPWIPAAYIFAAVAMMVDLLVIKPRYTWPGLLIALSGIPLYCFVQRSGAARESILAPGGSE